MVQDTTLHVKLDSRTDAKLKHLAMTRRKSKGQLVREAISACYQPSVEELPLPQSRALAAYQGGYISMGKLAKVMGMHALELRNWLRERDISQSNSCGGGDAVNA